MARDAGSRPRGRDVEGSGRDGGFTLIELMVSMTVLALVLGVVYGAYVQMLGSVAKATAFSTANDSVQTAVAQIAREVRSGNVLYNPANQNDPANGIYPGMSLLVYTQNNAPQFTPENRCVEWRIDNGQLQTRYWSPNWATDGVVTAWRTVTHHVVNQIVSPQVPAFALSAVPAYGGRLVSVDILGAVSANATPSEIQASVTGRDTLYGYPQSVCASVPPGG